VLFVSLVAVVDEQAGQVMQRVSRYQALIRGDLHNRRHPQRSPLGSAVERITSNDEVVSSTLAVGKDSLFA
jgi:hypothetical protein